MTGVFEHYCGGGDGGKVRVRSRYSLRRSVLRGRRGRLGEDLGFAGEGGAVKLKQYWRVGQGRRQGLWQARRASSVRQAATSKEGEASEVIDQRVAKRIEGVLQQLSWGDDEELGVSTLSGGLTNHVFLVRRRQELYTLRVFDAASLHFVNRPAEVGCHAAFGPLGLAPGVVASDAEHSFLMTEHVEGRCLTHAEYTHSKVLPLVTASMRTLHQSGKVIGRLFEPLRAAHKLFGLALQKKALSVNQRRLAKLFDSVETLLTNVDLNPQHFVPCHLDLVPGNVILSPTTGQSRRVTFIDWEYAAMAPLELEFANIFIELGCDRATELSLLRHYLQGGDPLDLYKSIQPFRCFAAFYWLLWCIIQEHEASLAVDYQHFARRYLEQAESIVAGTSYS